MGRLELTEVVDARMAILEPVHPGWMDGWKVI